MKRGPCRKGISPFKNIKNSFDSKIKKLNNGCWQWTAKIHYPTGYGHLGYMKKHYLAHRVSYEIYKSKIPKGLVIDHLCRKRDCVNPDHLEAVSLKENIYRGNSLPGINSRKTHCKRGHKFSPENTYIHPQRGHRHCKKCQTERAKQYLKKPTH